MKYSLINYLTLFVFTAIIVGSLTPKIRKIALSRQIVDSPNSSHKTHSAPVPYLGGVAIVMGILFVTYFAVAITSSNLIGIISSVLLPCLFLGIVGLVDDLYNLSPWPRFLAQSIVGSIVSAILIQTETVGSPTGSQILDSLITAIFIVGLSNSINFFDNIDGGASGTVAISAVFLAILSYASSQYYIAALASIIAGATLGFLWWNKSPAKIYMGDAGSLFLGSLMASLLVRFDPNPITYPTFFFVPLFLIAIPLLDTSTVIISRISRGISPFQGGRDHLSHRLMRRGFPKVKSVIYLWILTLIFGILAFALSNAPYNVEPIISVAGTLAWLALLIYFLKIPATDGN